MVSQNLPTNRWLIEYADRLVRLHRLIARDEGDSESADELRDEMDLPWRKMSESEIKLMGDLSVDLYTITTPPGRVEELQQEYKSRINEALSHQEYVEVLQLVRASESQLDISTAAFLRGICWSGLGVHCAAADFFLHAERSQPGMLETRLCALSSLISSGREKESLGYANQWAMASNDPALVLKAAKIMFLVAVRYPDETSRQLYSQSIALAEQALATSTSAYVSDDQVLMALLQIAVSHANLGDIATAREYSLRARRCSPDNVVAMMVDGMLNDSAPPVSNAARLEVARWIMDIPTDHVGTDSPVVQHSQLLQQLCNLN